MYSLDLDQEAIFTFLGFKGVGLITLDSNIESVGRMHPKLKPNRMTPKSYPVPTLTQIPPNAIYIIDNIKSGSCDWSGGATINIVLHFCDT